MKNINSIVVMLFALLLFSCSTEPAKPSISKEETNKQISELKSKIQDGGFKVNEERIPMQIIGLYTKYADAFPDDSLSQKYLFECAQVNVGLGFSPEAIANLDTIVARYPNAEIAPSALQFKAFILDDRMHRWQKAAEVIDELVEKYPDSDIIENAKAYKETLGKSPEQIIREMEAKNKAK